jgi:hypothetical protein
VLVQVLDIGIPAEEPEQFVNDGLEMDPLRRQQREASGERKPRLSPKYGISARASAVPSALPVLQYMAQQIKILSHSDASSNLTGCSTEGNQGALVGSATG